MPTSRRAVCDWLMVAICLSPLAISPSVANIGPIAAFLLAVLAVIAIPASRAPSLNLVNGKWGKAILFGIASGLVIGIAAHFYEPWITRLLGEPVSLGSYGKITGDLSAYLTLLAIGIIVGGVLEEFVFRGFVIGWGSVLLGERAAPWLAIASAISFGLGHRYQGPTGIIATGLDGLIFGVVYIVSGRRLLPAMLCHAASNVVAITFLYLG